jgi:hypothetical protein
MLDLLESPLLRLYHRHCEDIGALSVACEALDWDWHVMAFCSPHHEMLVKSMLLMVSLQDINYNLEHLKLDELVFVIP